MVESDFMVFAGPGAHSSSCGPPYPCIADADDLEVIEDAIWEMDDADYDCFQAQQALFDMVDFHQDFLNGVAGSTYRFRIGNTALEFMNWDPEDHPTHDFPDWIEFDDCFIASLWSTCESEYTNVSADNRAELVAHAMLHYILDAHGPSSDDVVDPVADLCRFET